MSLKELANRHEGIVRDPGEERVAALTRISRTLENLIDQLRAVGPDDAAARQTAQYCELRANAARYRWFLEVQREALGLRDHRILDSVYPIPN